jgi:prepilin-type N-terminal cleavage/methylation domain-containing protein
MKSADKESVVVCHGVSHSKTARAGMACGGFRPLHAACRGFSLLELLVVIGIIAILSVVVAVLGRGGEGSALGSSTRIVAGLVDSARGRAILSHSKTRLIIYANADLNSGGGADSKKFLSFFGVVHTEDDGITWKAADRGVFLPRGIFFDPDLSKSVSGSAWTSANTMTLDFPRSEDPSTSSDVFYYYEFEPNGRAQAPNSWLVLRAGVRSGANNAVDFLGEDSAFALLRAALIIRQAGTASIVSDPGKIK